MGKKVTAWKTKGMNRDLSVSAFNPEFAFENVNLRLSTNENNTMLSWVNERGPARIELSIDGAPWNIVRNPIDTLINITGTPIGTAVINHKFVLFVKDTTAKPDYIYVLWYSDAEKTQMEGKLIYNGNLNFSTEHPIETLVSYEAEHIQKVYWTDGYNQPRVINIEADKDHIIRWHSSASLTQVDTFFDFVPSIKLEEEAFVEKNVSAAGLFAPGVIQYCYSYFNRYGQQSNLVWVSPLYYLSHTDRGASPEDNVTNSFTITINNADTNFDYIRLYSIQRTSLNLDPIVKRLIDISINKESSTGLAAPIVYVDNGTTGNTVDPYELLYIGGKEITAYTMADKDQTLFMGNLSQPNAFVDDVQEYFDVRRTSGELDNFIEFKYDAIDVPEDKALKTLIFEHSYGIYGHTNQLNKNHRQISTFKGGETYRFGFQLQKKTGEWTEPIFINDVVNTKYPKTELDNDSIRLAYASASIPTSTDDYDLSEYKRIRPLIVYPTVGERSVLCQGVLNPTVFNVLDRIDNSPFAQASWYFRPYMPNINSSDTGGGNIPTAIEGNDSPSPQDDFFSLNGPTTDMYVMIADISNPKILSQGYIRYQETWDWWHINDDTYHRPQPEIKKHYFQGAIKIADNSSQVSKIRYALFSSSSWPKPTYWKTYDYIDGQVSDKYYESFELVYLDLSGNPQGFSTGTYKVYTGLKTDDNKMYYYNLPNISGAPDPYVLKFYTDYTDSTPSAVPISYTQHSYTASFAAVTAAYRMITNNTTGSALVYGHYSTLPSAISTGQYTPEAKDVEIQGSRNIVQNIFGTYTRENVDDSNTQFFIDQSIVTLNSPDIEFDTEVQDYSTEKLKLRIVGAVPITANISYHKMTTSSNMLESNYSIGSTAFGHFGSGELSVNIKHTNIDIHAGKRLAAEYLWNDVMVKKDASNEETGVQTSEGFCNYLIYPWHRAGSLNNDLRGKGEASSWLSTKKESNLLYSINTEYLSNEGTNVFPAFEDINSEMVLTENDYVHNIRLPRQKSTSSEINYYPNIDKILYNNSSAGYPIVIKETLPTGFDETRANSPVSMKYKSTSHSIISFNAVGSDIPILPYAKWGTDNYGKYENGVDTTAYWGDTNMTFSQGYLDMTELFGGQKMNFLWIGELYKDVENRFGGTTREALMGNNWLIAGDTKNISEAENGAIPLEWTDGDTFYQRYDCMKTYPFTQEDTNQLTEILSFMCETRINADGRYDKNRGQIDNTNMSPVNFNLLNYVYTQKDNFFVAKMLNNDALDKLVYPNQIWYSQTKTSGADIDEYTHVTLASILELEGHKGKLNALERLNDQIIAFQDTGISQVLYNENVQIASTAGVPIEIANSGKVQGARYISNTIGCSNKWSMVTTPSGLYFMDNNDRSIYLFNGQLVNISVQGGFNAWSKQNIPSPEVVWNPYTFEGFTAYYDKQNQDVLFINSDTSLAFSEKVGAFTSFYDYGSVPYLCNLDDTGVLVKPSGIDGFLFKHNAGEYCNFFGVNRPFSMTLIGNPEPTTDKIFTNLEFRATIDGEGTETDGKFTPTLPFDYLEAWNEYQHGKAILSHMTGHRAVLHHTSDGLSALKRKFRMWACDIPRDNAPLTSDEGMNIKRFKVRPMDRLRNPWVYLKLQKNAALSGEYQHRTEVHDMTMIYFS